MESKEVDLKNELRVLVRARKRETGLGELEEVSRWIMDRVEQMPCFREAKTVALYWSLPDEVATREFVQRWSLTKRILLPVMQGNALVLRPFMGLDRMMPAEYGIDEPTAGGETVVGDVDLIIVPGMGFDSQGRRLGRGKGFYDNLLQASGPYKIGVCFDFQLFDRIPTERHDVAMDVVVCGSSRGVAVYERENADMTK